LSKHKKISVRITQKNIVYKISCEDCDATYVGQTKRKLNIRISEHQINRKTPNTSAITEHRLRHNHDFNWSNVKILDSKKFFWKKIISEMLNIQLRKNGFNY